MQSAKDRTWSPALGWSFVILPAALQAFYIFRLGVDVPIWDEWVIIPFLRQVHEHGDWLSQVFAQHNEHRAATMRLAMAAISLASGWNALWEMFLGLTLQAAGVAALWRVHRRLCGPDPWPFVPVSALAFSLAQYQSFLFGMMFVWPLMTAAVVWGLYLVAGPSRLGFVTALACALLASFSLLNGLLIWPLGVLLLYLLRRGARRMLAWSALAIATLAFYFHGYYHPEWHPSPFTAIAAPVRAGAFFIASLGASLGAERVESSIAFGLAAVAFIALSAAALRRRRPTEAELVSGALILFALASAAMFAAARAPLGISLAVAPRYGSVTLLAVVSAWMLLVGQWRRGELLQSGARAAAFGAVIAVGLVASELHGHHGAREWSRLRRVQRTRLYQIERYPDDALRDIFQDPQLVRDQVEFLRRHHLSLFRVPPGTQAGEEWPGKSSGDPAPLVEDPPTSSEPSGGGRSPADGRAI